MSAFHMSSSRAPHKPTFDPRHTQCIWVADRFVDAPSSLLPTYESQPNDVKASLVHFPFALTGADFSMNWTPMSSPLSQANWQRRNDEPVVDKSRKNSFSRSPCTDCVIVNFAPVSDASSISQSLLQVPSMATIRTGIPRENTTRCSPRFSGPVAMGELIPTNFDE